MDKSRVELTFFLIEKISFSMKLFSGHFYGQSCIKTVRGPYLIQFYLKNILYNFIRKLSDAILFGNYLIEFYQKIILYRFIRELSFTILLRNYPMQFYQEISLYNFIMKLSYTILLGNYHIKFCKKRKLLIQFYWEIIK